MAKNKNNIAGLIREIFSNKNTSSETVNELYSQLFGLCFDFLSKLNIIRDVENIAEDLRGEVIDKILHSAGNDFWTDTQIYTVENDKKINSYVYTMVKECYRNLKDNFADGESIILFSAIGEVCKELKDEGFLKRTNDEYYVKFSNSSFVFYNNEKLILPKSDINLRRGAKGEQLSHEALKEYIRFLFEELENYCFNLSDLTKVVSQNSNFGHEKKQMDIDDPDNYINLKGSGDENDIIINDRIIECWISKFIKSCKPKQKLENALILVFKFNGITLEKTSEYLTLKKITDVSKSTIDNRLKNLLEKIGFTEISKNEKEKMNYLMYFLDELKNEFIPEEYIEDMIKMKMEELRDE